MDANTLHLRPASLSDAAALRAIYAPYVEKTAITFECTVPDVEAFAARMRATLRRYPYLVAMRGGEIVGYAYAGAFGERAAYAWAAEVSIYLREDQRRQGIGRRLYAALEALLRAQHVQTLCIPGWGGRRTPDEKQRTVSRAHRLSARGRVFALRL